MVGGLKKAQVGVGEANNLGRPEFHHIVGLIGHPRCSILGVVGDGSLRFFQGRGQGESDGKLSGDRFHGGGAGRDGIVDDVK